MAKRGDIDSLLRKGEIALSRAKVADSEPPAKHRDELISVSEIAEEVTGAAVRSAIEAQASRNHVQIGTPWGATYRGPVAYVVVLILALVGEWLLLRQPQSPAHPQPTTSRP